MQSLIWAQSTANTTAYVIGRVIGRIAAIIVQFVVVLAAVVLIFWIPTRRSQPIKSIIRRPIVLVIAAAGTVVLYLILHLRS